MSRNLTISYRALLLASVAGTAIGGIAQGQTVTNSTAVSGPTASFILSGGTSFVNTSSGSVTLTSGAAPGNAAVIAGTPGTVPSINNAGLITAAGARGIGLHVTSGGSVGTITNSGAVTATNAGPGGTAIVVDSASNVGTLANSGSILAFGNVGTTAFISSAVSIDATSSISAITNSVSASIQTTGTGGVAVNIGGGVGTLTNAGTILSGVISSGTIYGVANGIAVNVAGGATLGGLVNTGGIFATGTSAVAVDVFGSVGSITNSGTILGSADSGSTSGAVRIETTGSVTSITNNAGGTISSATAGGAVDIAGTAGTVTNNGLLSTSGGTNNAAVYVEGSGTAGSLINGPTGTILANTQAGYAVEVSGLLTSGTNSGTIQSTGNGGYGVYVDFGTVPTFTNAAGGLISATGSAFAIGNTVGTLVNAGTITSPTGTGLAILGGTLTSFVNSGLVSAGGPDGIAVNVSAGAITTFSNQTGGTITGSGTAIAIGGVVGPITNAGTIISATGTAISIGAGGLVTSGITNSAGGLISGTVAIDNSANITPLSITNAGSINGAILFGTGGDSLAITGGAITGNIVGQSGSGGSISVNLASNGTFVAGNTISAIDAFTVNSGTLANTGSILGALTLAGGGIVNSGLINSGTSVSAISVTGTTTLSNSGSIIAPSGTAITLAPGALITGGITNTAGGLIQGGPANGSGIAIDNSANTVAQTINNAGRIVGGIRFGTGADVLNINGAGTVVGNVTGQFSGTVNFNPGSGSTYALSNTFNNIANGSIVSGSLNDTAAGSISATGTALSVSNSIGSILNSGLVSGGVTGISVNTGGTVAGGITNTVSASITSAGAAPGAAIYVAGSVSSISNAGLVQMTNANSSSAIRVTGGVVNSLTNSATGTIQSTGSSQVGVLVQAAGSLGTLTNAGTIQSFGLASAAIRVTGSGSVDQLITNSGLIQTTNANGGNAISVDTGGSVGTIANQSGGRLLTSGTSSAAVSIYANVGTLSNAGQIEAAGAQNTPAIYVQTGGSVTTIANLGTGLIYTLGSSAAALRVDGIVNTITNAATFQTSGSGSAAIYIPGSVTTITNSGLIQDAGSSGGGGLSVATGGTVGSVSNTGTIMTLGSIAGINVGAGGTIGSVSNTGSILATNGTGILITPTGAITGGITNTATGLIQGGPANGSGVAINNSGNANALTISNAGSIVGGIKLGTGGDVLNITGGGTVTGTITGQSSGTLNFNTTGTYALANPIVSVGTVNVDAGALLSLGAIATSVSGASVFNVASAATVNWNGGTVGATTFTNSGLLNIGSTTATLTGSYTQTSTGQLELTILNTATHGLLAISNTASVVGTAGGIIVNVPTADALALIGKSITIASSSSLTVSQASSLTATSTDNYIFFNVSEVGNNIVLTGTVPLASVLGIVGSPGDTGATDGLSGLGLQNVQNVRVALNGLLANLSATGDLTDVAHILNTLNALSPTGQAELLRQLEPNLILNTEALLNAALAVNGGATTSINNRLIAARATSGMAAGDEVGRGFDAWVQPYGSFETQDTAQGVDGFKVNSYGAAFGLDTMVRPDLRLGMAFGFGNADIEYNGNLSGNTASVWNAQLAAYGTWFQDGFYVDGVLGGGLNWYSTHENQSALGYTRTGNFNGTQFNAKLGAGYNWAAPSGLIVTPALSLQETHISMDAYTTSGAGVLNVHVNSNSADILQSKLGARVAYPMTGYGTYTFTPEIHAYYLHNFGSDQTTMTSAFTGGGPAFNTTSPSRDRNIYNIGLGLTVAQIGPMALSGVYDYAGGATSHEHLFFFRFKTEF